MSALTNRLMPGCVDIPARRAHLLWAAQTVETDDDGTVIDRILVRSLHDEYAYNIASADEFNRLFRHLCELAGHDDWITARGDDTLVDHYVLLSHGRNAAYADAQARNDQEILDLLDELVPSQVNAEVTP